jgi:hypothetical protein
VFVPGQRPFTTKLHVAGQPRNGRDSLYRARSPEPRDRVTVPFLSTPNGRTELAAHFDIIPGVAAHRGADPILRVIIWVVVDIPGDRAAISRPHGRITPESGDRVFGSPRVAGSDCNRRLSSPKDPGQKNAVTGTALEVLAVHMVEPAGIEPASESPLQQVLHT